MTIVILAACQSESGKEDHAHHDEQGYTCPMHPQILEEKPGKCPVCKMDLVPKSARHELTLDSTYDAALMPVNEQVISQITLVRADSGTRIMNAEVEGVVTYDTKKQVRLASRVGGRMERLLVKYNYQPVSKGELIMEIYSPELASAQRELLVLRGDSNNLALFEKAKQRLSLLGMSQREVDQVLRTGQVQYKVPVYSPTNGYIVETAVALPKAGLKTVATAGAAMGASGNIGGMVPPATASVSLLREGQYVSSGQTLFTLYQLDALVAEFALSADIASQVKHGQKVFYQPIGQGDVLLSGSIGLIDPVFRAGEKFSLIRVYTKDKNLIPGQLLKARIPLIMRGGYWLNAAALWQTGTSSVVFKEEEGVLVPHQVETGIMMDGQVQVLTDIEGWKIASNAAYLIDSESFVRYQEIIKN
ncbi:multidrug resistance efflux pump [Dyadobacter jejuensis]|uniref:Multidrug resistance efflux pump n=2 Tax=Dyadobacter jejuensis TaxID=1082580 RepID=A0A316B7T2_9BACT|nr:multidrug resistance efflux pump [Dyadobacter jejuensis]